MEYFISGIMPFGANFAPKNWVFCAGGLLAINDHQAVFALMGTGYGGDGRVSFGVPDLRGRAPIGVGTGHGLSTVQRGQPLGSETHTLTLDDLPAHSHEATFKPYASSGLSSFNAITTVKMRVSDTAADSESPVNAYLADTHSEYAGDKVKTYGYAASDPTGPAKYLDSQAFEATTTITGGSSGTVTVANTGLGDSFSLRGPGLGMYYILSLGGIFPARN
ncbi:MAG: tail fiber protein [Porticoccaceae bacterium]|nr:tail fiber protein [Porticoccaceae bacterium]